MFNLTGQRYHGHFSPWITNAIQEHLLTLQDILRKPTQVSSWMNGNFYIKTDEVIGILPIPDEIRLSSGMAGYMMAST